MGKPNKMHLPTLKLNYLKHFKHSKYFNIIAISELSDSRPSGGDLWPSAMSSMGMRQFGGGSELGTCILKIIYSKKIFSRCRKTLAKGPNRLFTSLKSDLHQDINWGFGFRKCLNGFNALVT